MDFEDLIELLCEERSSPLILTFMSGLEEQPEITVDKEDGANDEFVEYKKSGFGLHFMSDKLVAFHLHSSTDLSDYGPYKHRLPMSVSFNQPRSEIIEMHGKAKASGGGKNGYLGYIPHWLKYEVNGNFVHFQFSRKKDSIQVITVMNYE